MLTSSILISRFDKYSSEEKITTHLYILRYSIIIYLNMMVLFRREYRNNICIYRKNGMKTKGLCAHGSYYTWEDRMVEHFGLLH